jgi:Leucine-rich repeat (LRR) protein
MHEAMWNDPSFNWLKRLKDVAYDVDDVVDEFQLKAEKHEAAAGGGLVSKYMFTKPKSFILECKVASKIKKIRKRFDAILKQRADFNTIANSLPFGHPVHHMNKTTFEMQSLPIVDAASVLGREQDKDKMITELVKSSVQQEIEIMSVTGLGGSGKSTLAKLIFSDGETIKKHFELTLWVHVSQEFNFCKLIEKLFEAVTKEKSDKHPFDYISEEISERLNGKRFLLVLDDVWTGDRIQWEQFMVHLKRGSPGSKILLTTHSRKVAEAMESIYIFDLPFLSFDDSWQLFHHSFGAVATGLSPEFQETGKEIVRKCGGVPLAIKSLAGVLRGIERRIEDWQAMRDNNLLNVQEEEHRVASCLRLSNSHLESDLKQCFTICSVFPKGHKIDKEQLIDLWIAHDIISKDCIGNKHFNSLVQISFMQNVEEENGRVICRMHDLVHDLAQLILGDEISFVVPMEEENSTKSYRYFSLREQPEVNVPKNIFGKARAVYITKCYDRIFGMALEKAKHLRSVTVGSPYVTALPNAIFQISNLKYLSMSRLNYEALPDAISEVWSLQALHITDSLYLLRLPESIGKLKKLRTLNLSGCWYLNRLPDSIGGCHMLSNIDLWHCENLTVLPNSIGRNKELRVLRLGCTRLRRLPSITTLENLECLDLRRCHELERLPEGITNLKKLEVLNLEGCVQLRSMLVLKGQELDRVQNMNIFVVGQGKISAQMSEHANIVDRYDDDLPFGHTFVMEPDDAHKTCLKQKTNIQSLNL